MVGPLKYYTKDPGFALGTTKRPRGSGYYWHRGKGIYSKYDRDLDVKRKATKKARNPFYAQFGDDFEALDYKQPSKKGKNIKPFDALG